MRASFAGLVAAAMASAVLWGAPGDAHAVELYYDAQGRVVAANGRPVRVIVRTPVRHPRRHYVGVAPPIRVVTPSRSPARVHVQVRTSAPPPANVVVDRGSDRDDRDPYDTDGLVVAGGGAGGIFFLGDGIQHVAVGYKLHLGLAVGAAEFALNFDLVPDALELTQDDGTTDPAALYTTGASFNYRFLDRATVHPVAGIGLEGIIVDPHAGATGTAFAITGRAGLELAYPLADGALALGIDVTGHHPFAATDEYAADVVDMMSFGAYGNYRF